MFSVYINTFISNKKVQPLMEDRKEEVYSKNPMNNDTSVLPSREMIPKWFKVQEKFAYAPEVAKVIFMNELSRHIE